MANKVKRNIKQTNYVPREEREDRKRKRRNMIMGIIMLIIMVLSVAGFALVTSTGHGGSGNDNLPSEVPLQQFTDPYSGQVFWGAIKNNEQFLFLDIEGFDDFNNLEVLGSEIKTKAVLNVYIDDNFTSSDAVYNIEKVLTAFEIPNSRVDTLECNANTIVLTNEQTFDGDCLVFEAPAGEEARFSEALLYHMVK